MLDGPEGGNRFSKLAAEVGAWPCCNAERLLVFELRRSDPDRRNDSFGGLALIARRAIVLRERSGYPVGDLAHGESVLYKQSLVS